MFSIIYHLNSATSVFTKWYRTMLEKCYYEYLSENQLRGFRCYKYNAIDTNPLGKYILQPYWNFLIKYVPLWIAPNLITFTGFLFATSAYFLFAYLDYDFYASSGLYLEYDAVPQSAFLYAAIAIFLNHCFDGLDGKQARRTGTSGPLGELFDHGLDSWTAFMLPSLFFSVFGRGDDYGISPFRLFCVCWNVFTNFYLSHVEKYITGVLYLPWSYDYAMLGTVFVFFCSSILGFHGWKINVYGDYTVTNILEFVFYFGTFIMNIPVVAWNIFKCYYYGTGEGLSFLDASRPLWSFLLMMFVFYTWVLYSPTDIIEKDPRAVFALAGTMFSHICCRLIIAQMSGTECDKFCWLLVPSMLGFGVSLLLPNIELHVLRFLTVFTILFHIHFGICVMIQICDYLGIRCFRITPITKEVVKKDGIH